MDFKIVSKNISISVVMPVYNCAKYVREAIESILNQTYKDFEFLIINDGSTDETSEILNEYAKKDSRIKIIYQPNSGIVVALNKGLNEAKGEWIFRMDGDDISLSYRFETQIEIIKKNPALVLLGGWYQQINAENIPLEISKCPTAHEDLVRNLETRRSFFPHSSACFKRDIVLGIGGYRERFRHSEDIDLWLRLAEIGKLSCIDNLVLQLRKHEENISNSVIHLQQLRGVTARICYFCRKIGLSDPSLLDENKWQKFTSWVEKRMDEKGCFQRREGWLSLRRHWYDNPGTNRFKRIKGLVYEFLKNALARRAIFRFFFNDDIVSQLVREISKNINDGVYK